MDSFMWLAIGMVGAAYFIGDGLKNFKNPNGKTIVDNMFDEDDEHELIKESEVHHFMGITKEDAKALLLEHPEIPHISINKNVYYPKSRLKQWLLNIGD